LLAVLKVRFKKLGLSTIVDQKYILLEAKGNGTRCLLESTSPWETIMRPGNDVTMSMVSVSRVLQTSCPNCKAEKPKLRRDATWYVDNNAESSYSPFHLIFPYMTII
jgi:Zn finger protein HypA/HybF involved in hydrogenase expression